MEHYRAFRVARVLLAALLMVSFVFSVFSIFFRSASPRMSLGRWGTDHISHPHATILFAYRGLGVYRFPVEEFVERDRSESTIQFAKENDLVPNEDMDWFRLPERAKPDTPVFLNWPELARVYPPGLYVYCLPEALALEFTDVPLWAVNAFSLVKFSVVAHLLLWFLMVFLLQENKWDGSISSRLHLVLSIVILWAVQVQICLWTLSGFFDGLSVLFLVLLLIRVHHKRWAEAVFFFALAVFFHYRALWYAPLAACACFQLWQLGLASIVQSRWQLAILLIGLVLLVMSGGAFVIAYPSMVKFPLTNEWHLTNLGEQESLWLLMLVTGLVICLMFRREWLLLACTTGVLFFLFNTRQLQYWHSLFLVPLVLGGRDYSPWSLLCGGAAYALLSFVFFRLLPFDPAWARLYYFG